MPPTLAGLLAPLLGDRSDPDDPVSVEHVDVPAFYADIPKGLAVANDLRDMTRPAGARGRSVGLRPWAQIAGLCYHQTGTRDFAADHKGLSNVPAHAMIHRSGSVSLLHHPTAYVQHGNALNGGTIGIEVACRAAGTEGHAETFWRSKDEIHGYEDDAGRRHPPKPYAVLVNEATDAQLRSLSILSTYYIELIAAHGGEIRGVWGHIQGTDDRGSDPGSRIWAVAENIRVEHGLPDRRDMVLGKGKPIPAAWRLDP